MERLDELRDQQEEEETDRLVELQENEDDDELWYQGNDSDDDTSDSGYYPSDGSSIVDYETYSEADPNDYDPSEVDGGPIDDEDEFFETGEDPDDDDIFDG